MAKKQSKLDQAKNTRPGDLALGLAALFLALAWFSFLYPLIKFQFWQPDTFWLIEVGRLIIEKFAIPSHDTYSFTASAKHWYVYQWLTEVIFNLAHSIGGLSGVAVVGASLLATLFALVLFGRMLKEGTNPIYAFLAIWMAAYSFFPYISALRPQLISFVLFALLCSLCAELKSRQESQPATASWRTLLPLFLIGIVWVNCHLSFAIGLVILGANLAGTFVAVMRKEAMTAKQQLQIPVLILAAFAAGTVITPHAIALYEFLLVTRSYSAIPNPELAPLDWSSQPQAAVMVLTALASCFYLREKVSPGEWLTIIVLLIFGNSCGRLIVYFYIYTCPIVGGALTKLFKSTLSNKTFKTCSDAITAVSLSKFYPVGVLAVAFMAALSQPLFIRDNIPVAAAKFIAEHPPAGKLFCDAQSGSYLIYTMHGKVPVFFDTRLDLYDQDFAYRFLRAYHEGVNWQGLFAHYNISSALVSNRVKLKEILDGQPAWKAVYRDQDFSLYQVISQ